MDQSKHPTSDSTSTLKSVLFLLKLPSSLEVVEFVELVDVKLFLGKKLSLQSILTLKNGERKFVFGFSLYKTFKCIAQSYQHTNHPERLQNVEQSFQIFDSMDILGWINSLFRSYLAEICLVSSISTLPMKCLNSSFHSAAVITDSDRNIVKCLLKGKMPPRHTPKKH